MNINYKNRGLTERKEKEIERLLSKELPFKDDLKNIWFLMDKVWDEIGFNNKSLDRKKIQRFYSHPVWFLNGLFIEQHNLSMQHRKGMAQYVKGSNPKVLDYGGGFGSLAKEIASYCPTADIEIYEPHASHFTYDNIADFNNIKIVDELNNKKYDYIFTTDVLEHIEDPISLIINFNRYLRNEGVLVAAWNFTSCIKCHLPKHFHFRYTMRRWIISSLGFLYIGKAKGGHGYVFKKVKEVNRHLTKRCHELALISKTLYPIFRVLSFGKKMIKDITGGSGDL